MNTKTVVGIVAMVLALAGAFFGGRSSKNCPQSLIPSREDSLPETKPLVQDTFFQRVLAIDTLTKRDTLRLTDTLYQDKEVPGAVYRQTFAGRWPHTGDSAIVWGRDSLTLIPFGFVAQQAPIEARMDFGHQPVLEVGAIWSWGGADQLWATVPNLARRMDRRVIYIPERVGVSFQPSGHRWGMTVGWSLF